jgi:hypothetical protein
MTEDEAFDEATRVYKLEHANDPVASARVADRERSIVKLGSAPAVTLRDANGVPLGTVVWYGDASPAFDPPTKVTVVDHFQSLPKKS